MKTRTPRAALRLNRETVRELSSGDLAKAEGGQQTALCHTLDPLNGCGSYFPSCYCAPTAIC